MHLQDVGKRFEGCDGYVFSASLDATDVRAVNIGTKRQSFLRQALSHSQASQVPANGLPHVHGSQKAIFAA